MLSIPVFRWPRVAGLAMAALCCAAAGCGGSTHASTASSTTHTTGTTGIYTTDPAGEDPVHGGTLTFSRSVQPTTLDPDNGAELFASDFILPQIFDQLLEEDGSGSLQPDLATSWTVDRSDRVYTFVLRQGVRFANGMPLTANDVVFTFHRLASPTNTGTLKLPIRSITALSPDEVRMVLTKPLPAMLDYLADPIT